MKKRYAIADEVPEDCAECLTAGREYEILDQEPEGDIEIFCIEADDGIRTWCNLPPADCELIDGTWRIVEREE